MATAFPRVVLPVVVALLVPSVASAHLALRRSDPAASARVESAPAEITLWFTQRPQLAFSRISLTGSAGPIALGPLEADTGNAVRAALPAGLGPGEYLVRWQAAASDGHPIRGEFRFVVAGAGGTAVATETIPAPIQTPHVHEPTPEAHATSGAYRAVRWFEFVALLTVLGVIGFHYLVLPALASRGVSTSESADRARRLGQWALALYLPAVLVRLYAESRAIHGAGRALVPAELQAMLGSTWGTGWLAGIAGGLLILGGWRLRKRKLPGSTTLAVVGGAAMALSPALSGHAAADTPMLLSVGVDALHVLAGGVWVGGLLVLLIAGLPVMLRLTEPRPDAAVSALVNSFHPVALFCAPLVVASGLGSGWMRLGGPAAMFESQYGRVLLVKLALFVCVALLGLHNSLRARRRLGTSQATGSIRATAWAEVGVAALVLAVTTVLVVTPIPVPTDAP